MVNKDDKNNEREIMDYLDGLSDKGLSNEFLYEAEQLKEIVNELHKLPLVEPDASLDQRFRDFSKSIQQKMLYSGEKRRQNRLKIWIPLAAAACLTIVFYLFKPNSLEDRYKALSANTARLNFVFALTNEPLTAKDIAWLNKTLAAEQQPNIKIAVIDVLDNQSGRAHDGSILIKTLSDEDTPAVQMALLNAIETNKFVDLNRALESFAKEEHIDVTVRQRAVSILNKLDNY